MSRNQTTSAHARNRGLSVVGVATVVALMGYVGCTSPTPEGPGATPADPGSSEVKAPAPETKKEAPPVAKVFRDWPTPAAALVVSGQQLGYLEPCGCTKGQLGGLLRRYDFVQKLRDERKWPVALLDLGSLVKDPNGARGGPDQSKLKFHIGLRALGLLKYDAMALSPDDLKVGVDEAIGQFLNLPDAGPKVVAANVVAAGLESKVVPSLKLKVGGETIGVTAAVDPEGLKALRDPALDLLEVKPIEPALTATLASLEKDTKTQVLLVQGSAELAKKLATAFPGFEIVVRTSNSPDPDLEPEELNGGKTFLIHVGQKGKYIGVVGLFEGEGPRLRYQRVTLGPDYDGAAPPMKALIEDEFRETLKQQKVVENFPRRGFTGGTQGVSFVGAETCKVCHPNTFARWATTKHAHAFESLEHDPKPNAIYDAECVTCHTTGFEYHSGWTSAEATPFLKGNQCENCHGPGSKHIAEPDNAEARAAMKLTAELADQNRLCLRCHDEDNSPEFDFSKYWGQVVHKALDTYTDPKVHQGIAPRRPVAPK